MGYGVSGSASYRQVQSECGLCKYIIAYFTLAIQTIEPQLIEEEKIPKYQLPVTLIARIAVDKTFQGKGFGRKLLFYHSNKP